MNRTRLDLSLLKDKYALLTALKTSRDLQRTKQIHAIAKECGSDFDLYVASALVSSYAKCGSMEDAQKMFDQMQCRDAVCWTSLLLGYAQNGKVKHALDLFSRMRKEGCAPDARTFAAAIKACTVMASKENVSLQPNGSWLKMNALQQGITIHTDAVKSGYEFDNYVASALVEMYAKCGSMENAHNIFETLQSRDVVSWASLMLGYVENGQCDKALEVFSKVAVGDARIFVAALKACATLAMQRNAKKKYCLERGMYIHSQAVNSGLSNLFITNALIDMYAKCASMRKARLIFDEMKHRDLVSWNTLLFGYVENGEAQTALELFSRMQDGGGMPDTRSFVAALKACTALAQMEEGKHVDGKLVKRVSLRKGNSVHMQAIGRKYDTSIYVANSLINLYAKCGSMADACKVFYGMKTHKVVSWTALILGYADNGEGQMALDAFERMKSEGCAPNSLTFVAVLRACGLQVALGIAKTTHSQIVQYNLQNNAVIGSALADCYAKCGSMPDAQFVFDSMPTKDLALWNALISGYGRQGDAKRVFYLFDDLKARGGTPNGITFLSILTACSHAGLVAKGEEYFDAMHSKYGITPCIEHYVAMVDMLGRDNQLEKAMSVVKNMPFKPDAVTWRTILGACKKWKNVEVAKVAFEYLRGLDEGDSAGYVLMGIIYGSMGMWEEQSTVETMRMNARAWRKPGKSWWMDDTAGKNHSFVTGDKTHEQSKEINEKLEHLLHKAKEEEGYVPDLQSVAYNIADNGKEDALCGHSEKMAIACALINTNAGRTIRVGKNLRICDDCHKLAAIISKMEQRNIVCKDSNRFHVFQDGKCSCGDFW